MSRDLYCVVTRYTHPSGHTTVHTYGPYFSRQHAVRVRNEMLRDTERLEFPGALEARTCKLIGDLTMNSLLEKVNAA